MKKNYTLTFAICITFLGCHMNKPTWTILDYSWSSNWQYSYSLKIDDNGKAFFRKNNLKIDSFFVRKNIDTKELNMLTSQTAQAKLDSQYIQNNVEDAPSFKVIIYPENGVPSQYNVYGDKYPLPLKNIASYCRLLSEQKGWIYLKDTTITFDSYKRIPKLQVDNVKFPPPIKKEVNK